MKNRKRVLTISLIITLSFVLSACNSKKNSASNEKTTNFSFNIDGDKIYIKDADQNVVDTRKISQAFLMASLNVNYKDFKSDAGFQYYTKEKQKKYTAG